MEIYINKLIENVENDNKCQSINLILDSGLFNGSYLVGGLNFINGLECKNIIKIKKISSCSIGSFGAFLYYANLLDLCSPIYYLMLEHFKKHINIDIFPKVFDMIRKRLPRDFILNEKIIYISYYNIKKGKKVVRYKYRNLDHLFETIQRSCFLPIFVNGNILYKGKYCDGFTPYYFPCEPSVKTIFLDLYGYDKISEIFFIRNEKNNFYRMLSGILDTHLFFVKKKSTLMCSFKEDWTICQKLYFYIVRYIVETILINLIGAVKHYSSFFLLNQSEMNSFSMFIRKWMII
jgi:hypothetical protein